MEKEKESNYDMDLYKHIF